MSNAFGAVVVFPVSMLAILVSGTASAFDFQAGNTKASIYGYAKLDLIYDVDGDLGNAVKLSNIRLDGEKGPDGFSTLHAFQSRLGIASSTATEVGDIKTVVEGDFFGSGGGNFRLRHAYGEWNGITAGQTWTNFGGFLGVNPTIDFTPEPGQAKVHRQAQLRYTTNGFSIALEDPGNLGKNVTVTTPDVAKNTLPDLTMRYSNGVGSLNYGASAVLREIEYYQDSSDSDKSAFGWGLNLEAAYKLTPDITLRGAVTHGDGIGGYLEGSPAAPGYVDPLSADVETISATGGTVGITVNAGPGAVTLGYGFAKADLGDAVEAGALTGSATEKFQTAHLNYIWSPIQNVSYGIEIGHHIRNVYDGREGDATRLQGMVKYQF